MMLTPEQMADRDIAKIQQDYEDKQTAKRIKAGVPRLVYFTELYLLADCVLDASNNMVAYSNFYDEDADETDKVDYKSALASFNRNLAELNELWSKYDEECKK